MQSRQNGIQNFLCTHRQRFCSLPSRRATPLPLEDHWTDSGPARDRCRCSWCDHLRTQRARRQNKLTMCNWRPGCKIIEIEIIFFLSPSALRSTQDYGLIQVIRKHASFVSGKDDLYRNFCKLAQMVRYYGMIWRFKQRWFCKQQIKQLRPIFSTTPKKKNKTIHSSPLSLKNESFW